MNKSIQFCCGCLVVAGLELCPTVTAQGFVNFDFEGAVLPSEPVDGLVSTSLGIPGWRAFDGGEEKANIYYNTISLGGAIVNVLNARGSRRVEVLEGNNSLELTTSSVSQNRASITQVGQIPGDAKSLLFHRSMLGRLDVRFEGNLLSEILIQNTEKYQIWGVDIGRWAGRQGELSIGGWGVFDNLHFSSLVISEPSTIAIAAAGFGFLGWRALRPSRDS